MNTVSATVRLVSTIWSDLAKKYLKVSISVAESCPNREGHNGAAVCIFCDEWGSAAYHQQREKPVREQIQINREAIRKRYRAEKFLIYFQAYTNTFGRFRELENFYKEALKEKDVVGIVVGTRPDCLPKKSFTEIFRNSSRELSVR